jgi:hypothetical protein
MYRFKHAGVYALNVLVLVAALSMSGCFSQQFVVGTGAQSGQMQETREWYILWGLVPISQADSKAMAGDAQNYTVKTEFSPVDVIIGIFTGIITVQPKTVTVTR